MNAACVQAHFERRIGHTVLGNFVKSSKARRSLQMAHNLADMAGKAYKPDQNPLANFGQSRAIQQLHKFAFERMLSGARTSYTLIYFWSLLLGLSGKVIASTPAPTSGLIYLLAA